MLIKILRYILAFEIIFFVFFIVRFYISSGHDCSKNNIGISQQEIEVFNSQWKSYIGYNKSSTIIKSLVSAALSNNSVEERTNNSNRIVTINGIQPSSELFSSFNNSTMFTVIATYNSNGLINNFDVSPIITSPEEPKGE